MILITSGLFSITRTGSLPLLSVSGLDAGAVREGITIWGDNSLCLWKEFPMWGCSEDSDEPEPYWYVWFGLCPPDESDGRIFGGPYTAFGMLGRSVGAGFKIGFLFEACWITDGREYGVELFWTLLTGSCGVGPVLAIDCTTGLWPRLTATGSLRPDCVVAGTGAGCLWLRLVVASTGGLWLVAVVIIVPFGNTCTLGGIICVGLTLGAPPVIFLFSLLTLLKLTDDIELEFESTGIFVVQTPGNCGNPSNIPGGSVTPGGRAMPGGSIMLPPSDVGTFIGMTMAWRLLEVLALSGSGLEVLALSGSGLAGISRLGLGTFRACSGWALMAGFGLMIGWDFIPADNSHLLVTSGLDETVLTSFTSFSIDGSTCREQLYC